MADNVTAPGVGTVFATDDIAGVQWPFAKLAFGPRDTAIEVDDATGKRLPVTGTFWQAMQPVSGTITANAGSGTFAVSAASLPLPTGAATAAAQTTGNASLASIDGKLGSLGQKAMSASAPVVIASDQAAVATYADNYARAIASGTITRLANTTAYAAGQVIGGSASAGFTSNGFTFSNFARTSGGVIRLERARLYKSKADLTGIFELRLYRAQPTLTVGDTGAVASGVPVGNASASARLIGRFQFDFSTAALGSDGAEMGAIPFTGAPITATLNGTDVFAVLVATGAYTPASGETFSVVLEGYAF